MNIRISEYGNFLIYQKEYTTEFIKETIESRRLNGLRIFADLPSERIENLSFLQEMNFLEGLSLTLYGDLDFSFLQKLENLRCLSIICIGEKEIDLSNLIKLEKLSILWRKKIIGLHKCKFLKKLYLEEYHNKDLSDVHASNTLKELMIKSSRIESLNGIRNFPEINKIYIGGCRRLSQIKQINELNSLNELKIIGCKKIIDYEELTNLPNLTKLTLNDCGEIISSEFLLKLWHEKKLNLLCKSKLI